jgi:flagellar hook-length control protein FliK
MESLQNNSKVNIVLNPEALGKVTIQLIKTGEGLSAQFTVANQEVRDLLMKGLEGLKETLTTHGVGVDNVSVKMNETQKSEYNADWTEQEGSRGGNKEERQSKDEKEKGLFEKMMAQTLKEENGNV